MPEPEQATVSMCETTPPKTCWDIPRSRNWENFSISWLLQCYSSMRQRYVISKAVSSCLHNPRSDRCAIIWQDVERVAYRLRRRPEWKAATMNPSHSLFETRREQKEARTEHNKLQNAVEFLLSISCSCSGKHVKIVRPTHVTAAYFS